MIEFNDKHLDFLALTLKPETRLMTLEGTIRSSKTVIAIQSFFYRVWESESDKHLIAAKDMDAINDNILNAELGLLRLFPRHCTLVKDKIGGYYVRLKGKYGQMKKIMLTSYSDKTRWTKVLGGSIECIFVDEVNIANKQFIDECFARQTSFDNPFTIWTLNGDFPTHWVYQDYINRCEIVGRAPASIRADMDAVTKTCGWYYTHWNMSDNPVMTPKKIEAAAGIYPVGSYYYTIKIRGERGVPGDLIYIDYIDDDKLVQKIDLMHYNTFGIGVDIGASRAQNSFVLGGFKLNHTSAAIIDKLAFQQVGYAEKTRRLIEFVERWQREGIRINYITVDNAEQNYIEDLSAEFRRRGLPIVLPCDKATIKQRIDLMILLLARGKIIFNDTKEGKSVLQAFKMARWVNERKGIEREDNNEWFNDVMDSTEYMLTRYMARLLMAAQEE